MTQGEPERFRVSPTSNRNFEKEYIVQLNQEELRETFPGTSEGNFLVIRSEQPLEVEIHARVFINDDISEEHIGLDFTLRTALGAPSILEVEHGEAKSVGVVEVEPLANPESKWRRRWMNDRLGVRPQVCRVRMGVFPDLEDKVCRLPSNTLEMIGVEEGDDITIESSRGEKIVRGIKVFEIDNERSETKTEQKDRDEDRYPRCEQLLELSRIRKTQVDIPEIWIDEETRSRLGLQDTHKVGVCQPVRVYRDSWYLFKQHLHEFSIPLVIVLFASGLEVETQVFTGILWAGAILLWFMVLFIESRSRL